MAGLSPSPPPTLSQPPSGHLSSCDCPSNAFKWAKPSTSASAPWDTAQATVLRRCTTTAQFKRHCEASATEGGRSYPRRQKNKDIKNDSVARGIKSKTYIQTSRKIE